MTNPVFFFFISATALTAQLSSVDPAGLNPALAQLFADFPGFSAMAHVRVVEQNQEESLRVPLRFQFLEGNMKAEIDMTDVKSKDLQPEFLASLKQLGMDRIVTIMRSKPQGTSVVYPGLKAVVHLPSRRPADGSPPKTPSLKKTRLGQETVDGRVCDKFKVLLAGQDGQPQEALVWQARDLKNFPVQIQMKKADATVWVLYRDLKMERPDAREFEVPEGSQEFASMEQVMQEALKRLLGGGK